jgi:hypothetical protein
VPQNVNLAQPLADLNPGVRSVRAFLYPDSINHAAEVAIAACCYVEMFSFSGNNQTGTQLLHGFLDTTPVPVMTFYNVSTFSQLLQKVFGP